MEFRICFVFRVSYFRFIRVRVNDPKGEFLMADRNQVKLYGFFIERQRYVYWAVVAWLAFGVYWVGAATADTRARLVYNVQMPTVPKLAVSPDGRFVASADTFDGVTVWHAATGRLLRRLIGYQSAVFSADNRSLIVVDYRGAALWDFADENPPRRLPVRVSDDDPMAVSADGRLLLVGESWFTGNGRIRIVNLDNGREVRSFRGHTKAVNALVVLDQTLAASASDDRTVRIWDVHTGREMGRLGGHTMGIQALAISPPNFEPRLLLTGARDGVHLWNVATGKELKHIPVSSTQGVPAVVFAPDGKSFVTAAWNHVVQWRTSDATEVRRMPVGPGLPGFLRFLPDGSLLVQKNEEVGRWDIETGRRIVGFGGVPLPVYSVAFSPDGRFLATGFDNGTVAIWDLTTGQQVERRPQFAASPNAFRQVKAIDFSHDSATMLIPVEWGKALLWKTEAPASPGFYSRSKSSLRLSPDGRHVLAAGPILSLWEVHSGTERVVRTFEPGYITTAAMSPDGRFLLTPGILDGDSATPIDTAAYLWDTATGALVQKFEDHRGVVNAIAFSADGRRVLTGSQDGTARLWEITGGRSVRQFGGHNQGISSVAFSVDGRWVATGSYDRTARVWNASTGAELQRLEGHEGFVMSVTFSTDGRVVATASNDQTARLWDTRNGRELARLISFRDNTWAVVDAEGRFDASSGGEAAGLHWVVGLEPVSLDQLKSRYYEPQLLAQKLMDPDAVREVAAFSQPKLYPAVEVEPLAADESNLRIKLTNQGGGIGRVSLFIDGKQVQEDARPAEFDPGSDAATVTWDLKAFERYMAPGRANVLEVKAFNEEGYLSSRGVRLSFVPTGDPSGPNRPTLWAVVAGVSDYRGAAIDLRFAAKDARDFAFAFALGARRLFGAEHVRSTLLASGPNALAPTKQNLLQALKALQESKPDDTVVVYLAGHGVAVGDSYGFLTQDAWTTNLSDPAVRDRTAITSEELGKWLALVPAKRQVMVLDTCAAGSARAGLVEQRSLSPDQIRAIERLKDRTGFFILMGSAADAVSYEATPFEQGLLTYSLLQGMRGAALRDGQFVDVNLLFQFAADEVPRLARHLGGIQRPRIEVRRDARGFDIGQLLSEDRKAIPLARSKLILLAPVLIDRDEGYDALQLQSLLRRALRERAEAARQGRTPHLPVVFLDTPELPGAVRPSGTYRVNGDRLEVMLALVVDGRKLTNLQLTGAVNNPASVAQRMVDELLQAVKRIH